MKIIKVDSCFACPYSRSRRIENKNKHICIRRYVWENNEIKDCDKIPDWCPLEDLKC